MSDKKQEVIEPALTEAELLKVEHSAMKSAIAGLRNELTLAKQQLSMEPDSEDRHKVLVGIQNLRAENEKLKADIEFYDQKCKLLTAVNEELNNKVKSFEKAVDGKTLDCFVWGSNVLAGPHEHFRRVLSYAHTLYCDKLVAVLDVDKNIDRLKEFKVREEADFTFLGTIRRAEKEIDKFIALRDADNRKKAHESILKIMREVMNELDGLNFRALTDKSYIPLN